MVSARAAYTRHTNAQVWSVSGMKICTSLVEMAQVSVRPVLRIKLYHAKHASHTVLIEHCQQQGQLQL